MTQEQQLAYLRMACAFVGISINDLALELLLEAQKLIEEKQGQTSIEDMVLLEMKVRQKYTQLKMQKKEDE